MKFIWKWDAVIAWIVAATWAPSDLPGGRWTRAFLIGVSLANAVFSYRRIRRLERSRHDPAQ